MDRAFAALVRRLAAIKPELVHRDFQSSNVLLPDERPHLIDFQGMRFGPAMYDVAALLCDPYVCLEPRWQDELLDDYIARRKLDPEPARDDFRYCAVQRLLQAIGAFARLRALPGMGRFAAFIGPGLNMLERMLEHTEGLDALGQNVPIWRHEWQRTDSEPGGRW